jgi:hypothetical protein
MGRSPLHVLYALAAGSRRPQLTLRKQPNTSRVSSRPFVYSLEAGSPRKPRSLLSGR